MVLIISYIFEIFLFIFILIWSKRSKVLGVNRIEYNISLPWVLLFALYVTYMFGYMEYNDIQDLGSLAICMLFFKRNFFALIVNESIFWYIVFLGWCLISFFYSISITEGCMMIIKLLLPLVYYKFASYAFSNKRNIWLFIDKMAHLPIFYLVFCMLSIPLAG